MVQRLALTVEIRLAASVTKVRRPEWLEHPLKPRHRRLCGSSLPTHPPHSSETHPLRPPRGYPWGLFVPGPLRLGGRPPATAPRSSSESSSLALAVLVASDLVSLVCATSCWASSLPAGGASVGLLSVMVYRVPRGGGLRGQRGGAV